MAYGVKFKLDFADVRGNPRKLEILKKDYTGDVKDLVGTESPVVLKWDADDDIYTPIIGSSCELNLYVTDDTDYDNWYESDEREYKVRISTGNLTTSGHVWNITSDNWSAANWNWEEAATEEEQDSGYEFYWEGFIVVDRYSEAVTTKPFPIKLVASDGLGTLSGFDAPFSNVILDGSNEPDPDAAQSNFDNLFYYLRKILENTGLDFDIYIANNIRSASGSTSETLFHDIDVYEFGLLKDNFQSYNAKELLEHILKVTNSRVFQSNGRWYVISNSNLIDVRMFGAKPTVEDLSFTVLENSTNNEFTLIGSDPDGTALTFAITDDVDNGSTSLSGSTVTFTPTSDFFGSDFFLYTASNGSQTSDAGRVTITVEEEAATPDNFVRFHSKLTSIYKGDTFEQAVARYQSWTQNYAVAYPTEVATYDIANLGIQNVGLGFTAGQSVSGDELSWRMLNIGSKILIFDIARYNPNYGGVNDGFGFPAEVENANAVWKVEDGYYALTQYSILASDYRSTQRSDLGISTQYPVSELSEEMQTALQNRKNNPYLAVIRVVNGEITETVALKAF